MKGGGWGLFWNHNVTLSHSSVLSVFLGFVQMICQCLLVYGLSPKWCTISIGKIKNGRHFFSHITSTGSGKTSGLWKWTAKWCYMLKCKDKLAKHNINCKKNNSSIQMHKLTFIWQSMIHYISSRYPCHMWLWMGSTNQITLYTHNKAISQLRHV